MTGPFVGVNGLPLVFRGMNAAEATAFISGVVDYAVSQGKSTDDRWMASFAGTRMDSEEVIQWYTALDERTRSSWALLYAALLQYPFQSPGQASWNVPSAPPAAPPASSGSTSQTQTAYRGRIKVVSEDHRSGGYISNTLGPDGNLRTTTDVAEALSVEVFPGPKPHEIKLLNVSGWADSWMAIHWRETPNIPPLNWGYGAMCCMTRSGRGPPSSSCTECQGPVHSTLWTVTLDGSITVQYQTGEQGRYIAETCVNKNQRQLAAYLDFNLRIQHMQKTGRWSFCRAGLVFEQL